MLLLAWQFITVSSFRYDSISMTKQSFFIHKCFLLDLSPQTTYNGFIIFQKNIHMKIKFLTLFIILCVVLCACSLAPAENPTTEPGTTAPSSGTTQPGASTSPTEAPIKPTFPEEYQEFPLDVFDPTQNTTVPTPATEPPETEPATKPSETEPVTEPVTEPPVTTLPGSGIELPEVPL